MKRLVARSSGLMAIALISLLCLYSCAEPKTIPSIVDASDSIAVPPPIVVEEDEVILEDDILFNVVVEAEYVLEEPMMDAALRLPPPPHTFHTPNTEHYASTPENGFQDVRASPLSTFSIDVDAASYANVRRFLNQGELPPPAAVRTEELINYFEYAYPEPEGVHPFSITTEASHCPWNANHRLVHIGLQGKRIEQAQLPTQNLVFLLDVSGSMNAPNKLPLVQRSLRLLVNQMRPQDRIAMVVYAGAAGLVLPSTPGHHKDSIMAALASLEAGGSTAGGEGIRLAYQQAQEHFMDGGNNRIILCTDGDFNVGVSSEEGLTALIEEKRATGIFLTVLGFGTGNYQDARMELLADKGNGNYAYIDNILEANKVLISEMGGTLQTIAKDVKLQVEFNPAHISAYRLIGYENRLLAAEDFNDDAKDAGELGAGHSVTALYEVVPAVAASPVSVDTLRYQGRSLHASESLDEELLTIKFRYKAPQESESRLITHPLSHLHTDLNRTSDNFRFSAAVAAFSMLLRDSKHKASANTHQVLKLARNAKGKDRHGYRAEFIRMVETYQLLASE